MNKTKVTPESWVVRQPQKLQTEKKKISVEEEDPFFDQIKYFLYVCRLLGRLPFERTKSGGFMFQLCSPVMVFTILMNAVQIYLTYQVYFINLTTLFSKNESYDDGVKLVLMVVILNVHFYAWVFVLIETGNISEYLNHWQQFNLGFEMINTLLACKMRHLKKETQQEIEMFLDIIEADPPVISIKGYFILNRQIFTAAVSTAVTYLVVLVQFKISSITT
uniref:Gustatory receptor 22.3 n=1 Tax=Subpsaltria yangi TaxID=1195109 RepID=A0A385IUV6_9HEMI|nr:gustatory receptor 22.3 [Subpsaltria yangi]